MDVPPLRTGACRVMPCLLVTAVDPSRTAVTRTQSRPTSRSSLRTARRWKWLAVAAWVTSARTWASSVARQIASKR